MPQMELVWVQQCAVCGCEHRHMECRAREADVTPEEQIGAFHARCQSWYRAHVDTALAFQSLQAAPR